MQCQRLPFVYARLRAQLGNRNIMLKHYCLAAAVQRHSSMGCIARGPREARHSASYVRLASFPASAAEMRSTQAIRKAPPVQALGRTLLWPLSKWKPSVQSYDAAFQAGRKFGICCRAGATQVLHGMQPTIVPSFPAADLAPAQPPVYLADAEAAKRSPQAAGRLPTQPLPQRLPQGLST